LEPVISRTLLSNCDYRNVKGCRGWSCQFLNGDCPLACVNRVKRMNLQEIYLNLKNDLELIEKTLTEAIQTSEQMLYDSSSHLLTAGGKRMRPVFVLLAGHFGRYDIERLTKVAVALELIHMATLVHDDVIDDADTRRGRRTVKAEWDNRVAMYTGDYIFARALQKITECRPHEVQAILATAINRMCLGEIDQMADLFSESLSFRRYLRRIKRKTALLMATSCYLGAYVSGAEPRYIRSLQAYGYYVGMAFQLTDDVLDFVGNEKVLGKPAGSDLRQGNVTLPVIYALAKAGTSDKQKITDYLRSGGGEGNLPAILDLIKRLGGIEYTLDLSRRYMKKAMQCLSLLPESHERESLRLIGEFIVSRSY
jgi:heptaprenyl diphosphate synthase